MRATKGEVDYAVRRALNKFDEWNEVSGVFTKFSGYYYPILREKPRASGRGWIARRVAVLRPGNLLDVCPLISGNFRHSV